MEFSTWNRRRERELAFGSGFPLESAQPTPRERHNQKTSINLSTNQPMQKITVLLADDHTVVRQGLRALLVVEGDIEIVGEAGDGRQAVQMVKKLMPDV